MITPFLSLRSTTLLTQIFARIRPFALSSLLLFGAWAATPARTDQLIATRNIDTGHNKDLLRIYDAATGRSLYTMSDEALDKLRYPYGIAMGPDGLAYVADNANARILQFDLSSRAFYQQYAVLPRINGVQYTPRQLLFGKDGHLFVLSRGQILRDDGTGNFTLLLKADSQLTLLPRDAKDFAIGPDGNFYVADTRDIKRYTPDGRSLDLDSSGKPTAFLARGMSGLSDYLNGLAFGQDGSLYLADGGNDRIVRCSLATKTLTPAASGNGLSGPGRMRFGPNGDLYVIHYNGVQEWRIAPGNAPALFMKTVISEHSLFCLAFARRGDVNADGNTDLLFQNTQTGEAGLWYMRGVQFAGAQNLAPALGGQWRIEATADLGGNGNTNLIWRNTQTGDVYNWQMNGALRHAYGLIAAGVPLNWRIVGAGDFNGDGYPDLVWQDARTGQAALWYMTGTELTGADYLPSYGPQWQVAAVADFNNNGTPDLLWRNGSDGRVALASMQGTTLVRSEPIFNGGSLDWQIAGAGDLNQDGYTDILWQNAQAGVVSVWYMRGSAILGSAMVANVPAPWRLTGPH